MPFSLVMPTIAALLLLKQMLPRVLIRDIGERAPPAYDDARQARQGNDFAATFPPSPAPVTSGRALALHYSRRVLKSGLNGRERDEERVATLDYPRPRRRSSRRLPWAAGLRALMYASHLQLSLRTLYNLVLAPRYFV